MTNKPCVVIPVYNHHEQLAVTLEALKQLQLPVIVVDDGNELDAKDALHLIADSYSATLLSHACNLGKGAAVKTGLVEARRMGFTHALQIDADGQHATADIPLFLAAMAESPNALIAGYPQFDKSVPLFRYYGQ